MARGWFTALIGAYHLLLGLHVAGDLSLQQEGVSIEPIYIPVALADYQLGYQPYADCTVSLETDLGEDSVVDRLRVTRYDSRGYPFREDDDRTANGRTDRIIHWQYDDFGQMRLAEVDSNADGAVDWSERFSYDRYGRSTAEERDTNGDGRPDEVVSRQYDTEGNLVLEQYDDDADGIIDQTVRMQYDELGYVLRWESYTGRDVTPLLVTSYSWSVSPIRETRFTDDADDGTIDERHVFTYDGLHRRIRTEHDAGNDGSIEDRLDVTYDAAGQIARRDFYRDGVWHESILREHDRFGRPLQERTLYTNRPPDGLRWSYACP